MVKLSRRQLTMSTTASLLFAPFISILRGEKAVGATGKKSKRLLLFCTMGTNPTMWTPPSASDGGIDTWSAMTEPLAKIKDNLILIEGLPSGNPGNGHGAPDGLAGTGYGNATSVEQYISDQLIAQGIKRPIPVLLLGAETTAGGGRTMFNRGQNLTTISSPLAAFKAVFDGVATTGPTMPTAPAPATDKMFKRRQRIVTQLKSEIATLKQTLGAQEKAKLDLHLDSIHQIEERLLQTGDGTGGGGSTPVSCTKPTAPPEESNVCKANALHLEVIHNAFACDITRVAAIQFGSDQSMPVDLPDIGLKTDQHGGLLHSGAPEFKGLIALERWLCERFVQTVQKLKATPEADGSGSLLDNTLIAWCRDMGDSVTHNMQNMRFVLAGGAGGYLRTKPGGRYIKGPGDSAAARHERVLLNLCEAMGVTNFSGFGDKALTGANKTPLAILSA
ncbi:MAG: DUF1552 domain-containing protein [Deltaproteobacteria bacterium]|nr:DUF1552 domain-containing protein [Deltaproteobacteria bacterium]